MMRMDLEEATCKAVSGFKPFFSPFFFRQQQYRIIEQKNQIRYRYINKTVYLFPIDWDKSPQLKYFNKQSCTFVYWLVSDKNRATGSYEHGFVGTQELHWPRNDADSGSDGLSNAHQRLPVPRIWMECFQHGWTYQQWVTRKLTFIYNTS